jgi:hypothetical protein
MPFIELIAMEEEKFCDRIFDQRLVTASGHLSPIHAEIGFGPDGVDFGRQFNE